MNQFCINFLCVCSSLLESTSTQDAKLAEIDVVAIEHKVSNRLADGEGTSFKSPTA